MGVLTVSKYFIVLSKSEPSDKITNPSCCFKFLEGVSLTIGRYVAGVHSMRRIEYGYKVPQRGVETVSDLEQATPGQEKWIKKAL